MSSLIVAGIGMKAGFHTTPEVRHAMETAETVLYLTNEPVSGAWIRKLRPDAEDLSTAYQEGASRHDAYETMVERMLAPVRSRRAVCAVFYGHPGVFVRPSHEAVRRAREEGFIARMLPGISAEDCLLADLEIEPAASGYQRFEATDFLLYPRPFDPTSALVLWQIGVVGHIRYREDGAYDRAGLGILASVLTETYGGDHEAVIYEAAETPLGRTRRDTVPLAALGDAPVNPRSTLYVPPLPPRTPRPERLRELGLEGSWSGTDLSHWRASTRGRRD